MGPGLGVNPHGVPQRSSIIYGFHAVLYAVRQRNASAAQHTISLPSGNEQAGRAPDSRETIRVRPDRRNFYSSQFIRQMAELNRKIRTENRAAE